MTDCSFCRYPAMSTLWLMPLCQYHLGEMKARHERLQKEKRMVNNARKQ